MTENDVLLAADAICRGVDFDLDHEIAEEIALALDPWERTAVWLFSVPEEGEV